MEISGGLGAMSGAELLDSADGLAREILQAEARLLVIAAQWAVVNGPETVDPVQAKLPGRQRARRYGGSGTPEVASFAHRTRSSEHGVAGFYVRTDAAGIARLDATVAYFAEALAALGCTDALDTRRAMAMVILANPAHATRLLADYAAWTERPADPTPPDDAPVPEPSGMVCEAAVLFRRGGGQPTGEAPVIDWREPLPAVQLVTHVYAGECDGDRLVRRDDTGVARIEGIGAVTEAYLGFGTTTSPERPADDFAADRESTGAALGTVSERMATTMDPATTSGTRGFRFGAVTPLASDLPTWRDQVRRIADSGFSTLLVPDVPQWQPAPGPMLAVAATLADDLRVGAWVYAAPLRTPRHLAWEAHSLSVLTDGRFELGIGAGRPGIEDELRESGLPVATPGQRLAMVHDTVATLRELDGPDVHTPVVMAVRGPKARALAADTADTVAFAIMPGDSRAEVVRAAGEMRGRQDLELAHHVAVVGDSVSAFMAPPDTDPAALRAADSLLVLPADPAAAHEEILRRREEGGFSYIVVGANAVDTLAPVVADLTGR